MALEAAEASACNSKTWLRILFICILLPGMAASEDLEKEILAGYPIIALRNPWKSSVRIYGQFLANVMGNNTKRGESSKFAACIMEDSEKKEPVHNLQQIQELLEYDEETMQKLQGFGNDYLDCHDPGSWAKTVSIQLKDGSILGQSLDIIDMERKRIGRLGVCSQSLHGDVEWLEDWVEHQLAIGADEVILHAPQGTHIQDLFNNNRQRRLTINSKSGRHPMRKRHVHISDQPLRRFEKTNVKWQDYIASPAAQFHIEELIFTACHYRFQFAYDYTVQFDVDEFWVPGKDEEARTLPDFLDERMNKDAASIGFRQVLYPKECMTRDRGVYHTRFTLHDQHEYDEKPAVRPIDVERMNIHGILHTSAHYQEQQAGSHVDHHWVVPTELAFLKNIRWDVTHFDTWDTYNKCEFGWQLDRNGTGLIFD